MTIMLFKFVNDEDVIADVEHPMEAAPIYAHSPDSAVYILKNPAKLLLAPNGGVAMMPMNPFSKDKAIKVSSKFVVYTAEPEEALANHYNAQFGNGLMLPQTGIIHV